MHNILTNYFSYFVLTLLRQKQRPSSKLHKRYKKLSKRRNWDTHNTTLARSFALNPELVSEQWMVKLHIMAYESKENTHQTFSCSSCSLRRSHVFFLLRRLRSSQCVTNKISLFSHSINTPSYETWTGTGWTGERTAIIVDQRLAKFWG